MAAAGSIRPQDARPLVIGIGASAGGLDALLELLPWLPPGRAAFVIVVHLSPDVESHLAEVLAPSSRLPVHQVRAALRPQAGHVYVIPPNWDLVLRGDVLALETPGPARPRRPVDVFLGSLAEAQGRAAVGVILSGAGSDGAAGLARIKAAGGVTFVQAPETAEFPSMPLNARPHADFQLPLDELAEVLARLTRLPE